MLHGGRETVSSVCKNCHGFFDFNEAMIITVRQAFPFFYFQNNAHISQGSEFSFFSLCKSICKILLFEQQISYYLLAPFGTQGWQSKYTGNLKTGQKSLWRSEVTVPNISKKVYVRDGVRSKSLCSR